MPANGDESNQRRDEIADALARLSQGMPSESEPPGPAPLPPRSFKTPPPPVTPPVSAAEFRAPPPRAARPDAPAPAPPPANPSSLPKARPARPDRPDRPAAPPTAAPEATEEAAPDPTAIIDDDDAVIVPAPTPDVFMHAAASKKSPARGIVPNSLAFRQTIIPILLTCGALLLGIGSLRWVGGADSVFSDMSTTFCAALLGCGALLLAVAALNMMQVRAELAQAARAASNSIPPTSA